MSLLKVNSLQDLGADAVVTDGVIASSALPTGSILQVVSSELTVPFSTTSTSYTDTGLAVTITPSSTSSKIHVFASVSYSGTNSHSNFLMLTRGTTELLVPTSPGSRTPSIIAWEGSMAAVEMRSATFSFLDSPNTTSATEYRVRARLNLSDSGNTMYVNRSRIDADSSAYPRGVSTITAMEVAG